jgi:hypothetical protein
MSALGHSLQTHSALVPINVRYASDSDQIADEVGCPLSSLNYDLSFDRARRLIKAPTRFCESFSSKSTGKSDTGPTSTELMRTRNLSFSVTLRSFSVELFAVELFSAFWVIFCMTVPCRFRPTTRVNKRCFETLLNRQSLRGGWLKSSAPHLTIGRAHSSEHIGRCQH